MIDEEINDRIFNFRVGSFQVIGELIKQRKFNGKVSSY